MRHVSVVGIGNTFHSAAPPNTHSQPSTPIMASPRYRLYLRFSESPFYAITVLFAPDLHRLPTLLRCWRGVGALSIERECVEASPPRARKRLYALCPKRPAVRPILPYGCNVKSHLAHPWLRA